MTLALEIEQRLAPLAPSHLELEDESAAHAGHAGAASGGGHFRMLVVSEQFCGLTALQRHRLVYRSLGELMNGRIHALSLAAYTPEEL
jgi:BolA protein